MRINIIDCEGNILAIVTGRLIQHIWSEIEIADISVSGYKKLNKIKANNTNMYFRFNNGVTAKVVRWYYGK